MEPAFSEALSLGREGSVYFTGRYLGRLFRGHDGLVSPHCPGVFRAAIEFGGSKVSSARTIVQTNISPSMLQTVLLVSSVLTPFCCRITALS